MPPIPAVRYPTWDALGSTAQQRLAGSIDPKQHKTKCARLNHFLGFIEHYNLQNDYLTDKSSVLDEILLRYVTFLLSGFTIQCKAILASTIKGYMAAINKHYKEEGWPEPWHPKGTTSANEILNKQQTFEDMPAQRDPLNRPMVVKMKELAREDPLGFRACIWNFVAIGTFSGYRQQEYAMDSRTEIKYYVLPDGTCIARAFVIRNFIFYDARDVIIYSPLADRKRVHKLGQQFDIQKNRMNGQIISVGRLPTQPEYKDFDPVENGLNLLERCNTLGFTDPDTPLCTYKEEDKILYLTGDDITKYFRFIARLVNPEITDAALALISTHSLRVFACVLLHEAGKDGPYIKLRLRWLSNCFEIYLRNTERITQMHTEALAEEHANMVELLRKMTSSGAATQVDVHVLGTINSDMTDIEDED